MDQMTIASLRLEIIREAVKILVEANKNSGSVEVSSKDVINDARKIEKYILKDIEIKNN